MAAAENHLIQTLPHADREQLLARCELIEVDFDKVPYQARHPIRHVYFPLDSYLSLLTLLAGKPVLEVGMVGREGMLGAQLALGIDTTPLQALVQGPGTALRMGATDFTKLLDASPALRALVIHYLYVLMAQLASSSACLCFHRIEPRLARWLLMSQDRAHSAHFHITHQFMAMMLGVRRVGVTAAASELSRRGIIEYRRGELTVLDRKGLEHAACDCYATNRETYRSVLGMVPGQKELATTQSK